MAHLELAPHFFFLHYVGALKVHKGYHTNFILQDTLVIGPNLTWPISGSLNEPLVNTISSLLSSSPNLETNIWFKHCLRTNPISKTQYKHKSIKIVINYQNHTWGHTCTFNLPHFGNWWQSLWERLYKELTKQNVVLPSNTTQVCDVSTTTI